MKKLQLLVVALAALVLLAPLNAYAIENGGVGGRPANPRADNPRTKSIFIYELKPGQQASDAVLLTNNTDTPQTIAVYGVDSVLSSGGAFACKQAAEPKNDVGAWLSIGSSSVTVPANSSQKVPFTITVPAQADVGEHDGCIAIQAASQTAAKSGTSGVVLSFRSAIRVAVTVPGKIIKKLAITSVTASHAKDGTYLVVPTVRNDGNVSLDVTQQIELVSVVGTTATTVKEGSSPVLPHSSASQQYEVKRPFWGGFYRARVTAMYNANPATGLGSDQQAEQQTVVRNSGWFFAAPAPAAAAIELAILLLVIVIIVWLVRRWRHGRHVRTHWQEYSVKKGDTLQSLAAKHNVSWQKLARANKLKPPYDLEKGQTLTVPPASKE